jgi:hypothetical protein
MATKDDGRALHTCACPQCREHPQGAVAQQHSALKQLIALSDEKSCRLVAAALACQYGRGGIARLALTGTQEYPPSAWRGMGSGRELIPGRNGPHTV